MPPPRPGYAPSLGLRQWSSRIEASVLTLFHRVTHQSSTPSSRARKRQTVDGVGRSIPRFGREYLLYWVRFGGGWRHHAGLSLGRSARKHCAISAKSEQCSNRRHALAGLPCRLGSFAPSVGSNSIGAEHTSGSEVEPASFPTPGGP